MGFNPAIGRTAAPVRDSRDRKTVSNRARTHDHSKPKRRSKKMRRSLIIAALAAGASAFAPVLPSLRRSGAQGPAIAMKGSSEDDLAAANLAQRRMVVGGLFALLAPLAGLPEGAEAAKSGGRVGGGSFRSKAPAAAPRSRAAPTAPTVITRPSVTVIQSAPAMPFGYGYGGGMFGMSTLMPSSAMRCI